MDKTAREVLRKMLNIIEASLIVFNQVGELIECEEESDALQALIDGYGLGN